MDFAKGWGRIERLLLIVGIILSIFFIFYGLWEYKPPSNLSSLNKIVLVMSVIGASWVPYLLARIIGWIVKGFIRERQEELK